MQYALLIYQDAAFEEFWANANDDERRALYAEYGKFGEMLGHRALGGPELGLSHTATTVRGRDGEFVVTDGPFAEVAEQLGGVYIVEARDLDEALEFAKALPSETVEVRPIVALEDRPAD